MGFVRFIRRNDILSPLLRLNILCYLLFCLQKSGSKIMGSLVVRYMYMKHVCKIMSKTYSSIDMWQLKSNLFLRITVFIDHWPQTPLPTIGLGIPVSPRHKSNVKVWAISHKKYILYRSVSIAITEKLSVMASVVWGPVCRWHLVARCDLYAICRW